MLQNYLRFFAEVYLSPDGMVFWAFVALAVASWPSVGSLAFIVAITIYVVLSHYVFLRKSFSR